MEHEPAEHDTPEGSSAAPGFPLGLALGLLALGSVFLYGALYVPRSPTPAPPSIEVRLIFYPLFFGLYFAAAYLVWRGRAQADSHQLTTLALVGAIAFRLLVLTGPVAHNNDTWRYLWEGRVALEGLNPYAAPPGADVYRSLRAELEANDDPLFAQLAPKLNTVRSVYGSVATGLFVLPHLLPWDRIWSMRLLMTLFDLGTVLVLMGMLRFLGRAPALVLIYAWNPVCMSAFPDRAHIDAPMTFLIALAVYLMLRGRSAWAGLVFGAALLVKLSPLYLALPLLRLGRVRFGGVLALTAALGAIPFVLAGEGALSGFREFGLRWQNADSIFGLLVLALQPLKGLVEPDPLARAIVLVAAPAYAVWRTLQGEGYGAEWLLRTCVAIAAAGMLVSPVAHPWYTTHLLIFLVFVPSPGLLLLTAATMCWFLRFYEPPDGSLGARLLVPFAAYREPWRWLAYPPVYVLLIRSWRRERRCR